MGCVRMMMSGSDDVARHLVCFGRAAVQVRDEAGQAADSVAAHLRLAAVAVEDPHGVIGVSHGRERKDDAIAADAKVAVAELDCLGLGGCAVRQGDAHEESLQLCCVSV